MTDVPPRLAEALEGVYALSRRLGEGGMALVYLAADLKHGRQVALKVLRPELAQALGPERFLREIAIAARLTHPNILPLLDSGDAAGTLFYVMPYVEGESLRDRLSREGQLPVDEAVRLCQRVALALGYAHGMGVIHRDIKPENILLAGGEPVVTDFGIAKAVSAAGETRLTETGFAVGTAAYMSPEQASAETQLDGRSDIYALGVVLYELLAGAPPFTGPTLHAITARKLSEPVPPLRTVRETVPPAVEMAVLRALAKLPADRFATAQHLADALEAARGVPLTPSAPTPAFPTRLTATGATRARWRKAAPWALAILGVVAGAAGWLLRSREGTHVRGSAVTPRGTELLAFGSPVALSPDGATLAFAAGRNDSVRLYARRLDGFEARPLPGTEGGDSPFFSPDGRWVGFFVRDGRQLKKVALAGGSAITVAERLASYPVSGVWGPSDTIYFANFPDEHVSKVPAAGGAVTPVGHSIPERGWFAFPLFLLPDGRHLAVGIAGPEETRVDVLSLDTGEQRPLVGAASDALLLGDRLLLYVPTGHHEVAAVRFDPDRREIAGAPVPVLDSIAVSPEDGWGFVSVARNGTLVYVPVASPFDPDASTRIVLVGRDGRVEPRTLPEGGGVRFSPDGRRLVYMGRGRAPDIYVYDLAAGFERRVTDQNGYHGWPIFSADGRDVVFNFDQGRSAAYLPLYMMRADGTGEARRLPTDTVMHQQPFTWAAGGRELVYTEGPSPGTGMDIWAVRFDSSGSARPLMQTAANESQPAVSPDGRWLAWMTDASGRPEVLVRRYPEGPSTPVSREGGREPVWGPGGREIYFRDLAGSKVMAATFRAGDPPSVGTPSQLFAGHYATCYLWCRNWDVSPDGRRFVMLELPFRFTDKGYWPAGSEIRIVPRFDRDVAARMAAARR